jgi:hypothetical protein
MINTKVDEIVSVLCDYRHSLDPQAFTHCVDDITSHVRRCERERIAALEALTRDPAHYKIEEHFDSNCSAGEDLGVDVGVMLQQKRPKPTFAAPSPTRGSSQFNED